MSLLYPSEKIQTPVVFLHSFIAEFIELKKGK